MLNKLQIPCQKIISGGQTGVDRGALDACLELNFECGGWCPRERKAEDGTIPRKYPLVETTEYKYNKRTEQNITDSDGTLIICKGQLTGGTLHTSDFARKIKKPLQIIEFEDSDFHSTLMQIIQWLRKNSIYILNVAGPRLSEWSEGHSISKQITSAIIYQIKKSASQMPSKSRDPKK